MLGEPTRQVTYRRVLIDAGLTAASFLAAHQLRSHGLPHVIPGLFEGGLYPLGDYLPLLGAVLVVWTVLLATQRLSTPGELFSLSRETVRIAKVSVLGVLILAAAGYLLRLDFVSRPFLVLFASLNAAALVAARVVERRTAWGRRLVAAPERVVVVVGCGPEALHLARQISRHHRWGFRLLGLVDADGCGRPEVEGFPVVSSAEELPRLLTREVVDEVVLALPTRQLGELEDVLVSCQELGVRVRLALAPLANLRPRMEVEALDGTPLLTLSTMPTDPLALFVKRLLDVLLAGVALVLSLPLWPILIAAIRLSSPGPALFRQVRCGLHGRTFTLLKFRTMVAGAEDLRARVAHLNVMDGPVFKAPHDPRITRIGRFLRRFSLDELPQLLNVLKGDMSLVGPRPPIPAEVVQYLPWQRRRLAMKPGVTCLWQVSGRSELDFATWMELDLSYIDHWSLWLDLKILVLTVPAVLRGRGAA